METSSSSFDSLIQGNKKARFTAKYDENDVIWMEK